jgi:amino acid adenylation domain-containing protein
LLVKLLNKQSSGVRQTLPPLQRRDRNFNLPLSFPQEHLWFLEQLAPDAAAYNVSVSLRLTGSLEVRALEQALDEVIARHESLRTCFVPERDGPRQIISPPRPMHVAVDDWSDRSSDRLEEELRAEIHREAGTAFDLASGPLLRCRLLKTRQDEHILLFTVHHIAFDGWSSGILVAELARAYRRVHGAAAETPTELPIQYADFALWQREWLTGQRMEACLEYWRGQLSGLPVMAFPTDHKRPPVPSYRGTSEPVHFSSESYSQLEQLAVLRGDTPFMVLLTAFMVLLQRYCNQEQVVLGTPVANRIRPEIERLIGFFVNTLVLRVDLSGNPDFFTALARVRETCLGAYAHQEMPLEKLVEELRPERDPSRNLLFQITFTWHNEATELPELPGLKMEPLPAYSGTCKFDFSLLLSPRRDGSLSGMLEYATDLFEAVTIERLVRHYKQLLEDIVRHPELPIAGLSLLSSEERSHLLFDLGRHQGSYPLESVCALLEQQVERTPDLPAIVFGERQLSYRELNERSNQLAHYLRSCGIEAETRAGIYMERGIESVVAACAILKAGGTYVPLDRTYPPERILFLLEDGAVPVVLTTQELRDSLPISWARILEVDREQDEIAQQPCEDLKLNVDPLQIAYLTYTSGSTGIPKGIEVPHRGIVRLVRDAEYAVYRPGDRIAQVANSSFDAYTFEIWGALLNGGTVVVLERETILSPKNLAAALKELRITKAFLTVSLFNLVAAEAPDAFSGFDDLLVGGEAVHPHWVRRVLEHGPPRRLLNAYGPTENTTFSTYHEVKILGKHATNVPIGLPIGNSCAWVLDRELEPAPTGVTGELYVAGAGLARGYSNRPELTAERFIPNPFAGPGERMYRTGDLARWNSEGALEFLGRNDQQVKIRGFRIEPEEIEVALSEHFSVRQAAVVVREDKPGEKRLVAYVAADASEEELREALRRRLPEYMVPAEFIFLDALPLTPNGKLDHQALPVSAPRPKLESELRSPTQELLAGVWKEVLARDVSADDNFFELGGHSLMATQVSARARTIFGVEVDLRLIFQFPVLRDLAQAIEDLRRFSPADYAPAITPVAREAPLPASFAQQRLWFIDQLEPGSAVYNVPAAVRIHGFLNEEALSQALDELVRRHEVLRTFFFVEENLVKCQSEPASAIGGLLIREDLNHFSEREQAAIARQIFEREAATGFNLQRAPLLRARLLCLKSDHSDHLLLFVMHHIVSDGWSIGVLVREMASLYAAFSAGQKPSLPELPIQYADFAFWQRNWLTGEVLERQIAYWRKQLADVPVLDISTRKSRPEIPGHRGASIPLRISPALTAQLRETCRTEGVTLFMLLLAAAQLLLSRWGRQYDVAVGTPVANRNRTELNGLIGFFVNTLVLRTDLSGDPSVRELLARVREICLSAYVHQDVPFERLVEELRPGRDLGRTPLFQVMFALQNAPTEKITLGPETRCELVTQEVATAKYELDFSFHEIDDRIEGVLVFNTSLFDAETAQAMATGYTCLLEAMVVSAEKHVSQLAMVPAAELQRMQEWQGVKEGFPQDRCLHELIVEQARRTPERVALHSRGQQLTYMELVEQAEKLAIYLQRAGIGTETRVGLCLERGVEMVVSMLAILMAGGAYVPLDPAHPPDRINFILEDSQAEALLTQASLRDRFPQYRGKTIVLDEQKEEIQRLQGSFATPRMQTKNLAYVIYTSGSTGRPKGVAIQHSSAVAMVAWAQRAFSSKELQRVLASTSICFDLSVFEIFVPLAMGGEVVVAQNLLDLPALANSAPTLINTVPSAAAELLRMQEVPPSARVINLAGEPLPATLVEQLYELGTVEKVCNLYGPSEDTTYSTWICVERGASVPAIGRPVDNSHAYVLATDMSLLPVGCAGELYVAGAGLARGYWNQPGLTAEKFLPDPFSPEPGARMYRTGDSVRWRLDGQLEFLGRLDLQVKIRGLRIEPGEIDVWLRAWGRLRENVTVPRETAQGKQLVCYAVPENGAGLPSPEEFQSYLRDKLPEYMVPSIFVALSRLPLTSNGKLDRKALPAPEQFTPQDRRQPENELEKNLVGLWEEILGRKDFGVSDNFFDLGGHSLLLVRLREEVRKLFQQELAMVEMFRYPTVRALAARLGGARVAPSDGRTQAAAMKNVAEGRGRLSQRMARLATTAWKGPVP